MSIMSLVLPTIGQPDSTEDPKINTALSAIQTWTNGLDLAATMGAWSSYTPTWTATVNPGGTFSLVGRYIQFGKLVIATVTLQANGGTTFGSGGWFFSLPPATSRTSLVGVGSGAAYPTGGGGNVYPVAASLDAGSSAGFHVYAGSAAVTGSAPAAWNSSGILALQLVYEAA